ncbi:MFS transporter [Nonomuraea fuscirosea]|uniref:MFS transporter n=1 Tax=Nonomuraea fuscirosea TaxID=1291556 RepID=UPI002DD8C250|nr:MFS transporter [Nonomuraea fuscirosea]WSA57761.1 MFS transporter [Nonomuraea fuscirosea]
MVVLEASSSATVGTRRVSVAVAAAGLSSFALLYAPQPVLPQLASAYGLDPGTASLAIGVATAALAVAVLPLAWFAGAVGRRRVIVWSVVLSALIGLLLPLAPSFPVLLGMRAVQGVAIAGFAGVAAAYLADALGTARLAGAVGAMIAGNSVGGMLGRLGAGFAAEPLGWHGALAAVAAVSLACALFTATTLPRDPRTAGSRRAAAPADTGTRAGTGVRVGLVVPVVVGALGMGAFVALYNAAGFRLAAPPLSLAPAAASLVFLSYAMGTASSAAAGRLTARLGRRTALVTALAVTTAGSVLTVSASLPVVVAGFAVLTAGFFAAHAVANAWVTADAPSSTRGRAAGLYTLFYYLGSGAGGTAGAVVYGHAGWTWLIVMTSAWLLLAALIVLLTARHPTPPAPAANDARTRTQENQRTPTS